jgi:hypothetical protein
LSVSLKSDAQAKGARSASELSAVTATVTASLVAKHMLGACVSTPPLKRTAVLRLKTFSLAWLRVFTEGLHRSCRSCSLLLNVPECSRHGARHPQLSAPLAALPGWTLTIPRASSPGNGEWHAASAGCGPHSGEDLLADCLVCCLVLLLAGTTPSRFTNATLPFAPPPDSSLIGAPRLGPTPAPRHLSRM